MTNESNQVPFSQDQNVADRNHAEYVDGELLVEMVNDDLIARRITIDGCRDIIQYLRDQDAQTSNRLERILAEKGQRAGDAANRATRIAADMQSVQQKPGQRVILAHILDGQH